MMICPVFCHKLTPNETTVRNLSFMVADKIITLGIISNQRNKNNFHLMDFYGFDFILLHLMVYIISLF
jgi:hypothetical protein